MAHKPFFVFMRPTKLHVILATYIVTGVGVLVYFILVGLRIEESQSIALLFFPLYIWGTAACFVWVESIVFMLLFMRSFSEIRRVVLPMFLLSSLVPVGLSLLWLVRQPADRPFGGTLPVSGTSYELDGMTIQSHFIDEVLPVWVDHHKVDTVYKVMVDTILYSQEGDKLFAFIILSTDGEDGPWYWNDYCAARMGDMGWDFARPQDHVWTTHFDSPDSIRAKVLEYFYKSHSINGSDPDKPEIWNDPHIFAPRGQ
jgi:hypothetical protein